MGANDDRTVRDELGGSYGWIGINDIDEDQNWVWPDSCPSTYGSGSAYDIRGSDQWCDNQPCVGDCDGYGDDQHCAFLNWDYAHTCNWVDAGCDADIPCVCGDGHVYATLSGVTLFDQHLVDMLAFTLHGNGFSIEHTDGAQIPAFDVSGDLNPSGKGFLAIENVELTMEDFTLVQLDSFTVDNHYDHENSMDNAYGFYCSNYAEAEALWDYDDLEECMEHCEEDADCTGGYYDYSVNSCYLFGTADSDDYWCDWEWGSTCLLYTSPSPRDGLLSRMPSSA